MSLNFRHIFLITYGRSGSTLLNGILNSIPGVCMRGENGNVLAFLARAVQAATYARKMLRDRDSIVDPWHGASFVDVESFRRKLVTSFVEDILRPPNSAIAIGFKEIRYGTIEMSDQEYDAYIEFLLSSFERPCLIFNVRNWPDVAKSEWWLSNPFARFHLRAFERRFERSMQLHPACTLRVEYDKYTKNPDELRKLFYFLGADYDRTAIEKVLATIHGLHSPTAQIESLRAARSVSVAIIDALARRARRHLTGHYY